MRSLSFAICSLRYLPTEDNPSLNLSHAVFAVTYALFTEGTPRADGAIELAGSDQVAMLCEHLDSTLFRIGYGVEGSEYLKESIMHNFKRLFGRTGIDAKRGQYAPWYFE